MRSTAGAFAFLVIVFAASSSQAQVPPRFQYCADFMKEANFGKTLPLLGSTFSLDPDSGVKTNKPMIKALEMLEYPGKESYRIELNPNGSKTAGMVAGLQISDHGGDPREFELVENFVENPTGSDGKPVQLHLFKYNFSFRNGLCLPTRVTRVDEAQEVVVFDFDRCREMQAGIGSPSFKDIDCSEMTKPHFAKALGDKRFNHVAPSVVPSNSKPAVK